MTASDPDHVNVFTAVVKNGYDLSVTDNDNATVGFTDVAPTVTLDKSVDIATLPEPGGVFTFTLKITNTSVEAVTITALTDDNALSPACLALVNTTLAAGASASCTYTVTHTEADVYENAASVTVADNEGNPASADDSASVEVTDVMPAVTLDKSVTPASLPEPGGIFTFTLTITNNSVEAVTITALTDDNALSGECTALIGTTLAASGGYRLLYLHGHPHRSRFIRPTPPEVTVADNEGNPASD